MDNKTMESVVMDEVKAMENEPADVKKEASNEITIKTAKGLVGEPFMAKDGKEYCEVRIPNKDETDKSPWATFVVRAAQIHDDKFGKGKWFKLPSDGTTTVSKAIITGQDENGKNVYENTKERFTNRELKGLVEFYKDRDKEQTVEQNQNKEQGELVADQPAKSFQDQMKEAKQEASKNEKNVDKSKAKTKSKGQEL